MPATLPAYDDLPIRNGLRSAWEVWGDGDDVLGCLNLLTPERAAEAAGLVERGDVFALNWSMGLPDPPLFAREPFVHHVNGRPGGTSQDDVLDNWNTQSSSQWDGFRHICHVGVAPDHPGTGHFGGVDNDHHGIDHWAQRGIVGRGVLADVGRWRHQQGRPIAYDESDVVTPDELLACLADQGTDVHEGDILLVRFGWTGWYERQDADKRRALADPMQFRSVGLHPGEETARVLWNLHVAAIGCDNPAVEVWPPGALLTPDEVAEVRADPSRIHELFVHTILLPMLGLPLGEMFALDALADDCALDGRYEFMVTSAPLNLPRGVASPPNALAIK